MPTRSYDVLIIGSGFAGAATAFHLSRSPSFSGSICIVEQEKTPGAHASGRNAALLLQSVEDPGIRKLAVASRAAYGDLRERIGFQEVGSLLLGRAEQLEAVREPNLLAGELLSPEQAVEKVPLLRGHRFDGALLTPSDGVIDNWALLSFYLEEARARGVELITDCEVVSLETGSTFRVETSRGTFETHRLVNAGGAWVSRIAGWAGSDSQMHRPLKRHLFVLDGVHGMAEDQPFVWNLDQELYFRPESGGLLFSMCDEEAVSHFEENVSDGASEALAEKILKTLPTFSEAKIRRVWACLRTHASDHRFTIGWDPNVEGLFWVAGLGGHGMGCSWEVGRLAAASFLGEESSPFSCR